MQRQLAEKFYEAGDLTNAAERYGSYISQSKNHFPKDEARYCQLLLAAGEYGKCAEMAVKLGVLGLFYIITAPISGHAIAKGAYHHGVRPEKKMKCDKYGEDLE